MWYFLLFPPLSSNQSQHLSIWWSWTWDPEQQNQPLPNLTLVKDPDLNKIPLIYGPSLRIENDSCMSRDTSSKSRFLVWMLKLEEWYHNDDPSCHYQMWFCEIQYLPKAQLKLLQSRDVTWQSSSRPTSKEGICQWTVLQTKNRKWRIFPKYSLWRTWTLGTLSGAHYQLSGEGLLIYSNASNILVEGKIHMVYCLCSKQSSALIDEQRDLIIWTDPVS